MATAKTTRKRGTERAQVLPMPSNNDTEGGVAVAEAEPEPATPFDPPAAPPRAPAPARQPRAKKEATFFERINAIARPDWGTRYFMYLYCLEPICNLKMTGENKYLNRYQEPIQDEQSVMVDYGSGKYRLVVVNRKPTDDQGDKIDQFEFEIYNPKYPPKIPQKVWMNDPRNERWEALLPKEAPPVAPQPAGTADPMASFETFLNIQDRIQDRVTPPAQPPPVAPVTAPASDPFDVVAKIMAMRTNDPMVALLMARMEAQDRAAEAARQREYELQRELRQSQTAPAATAAAAAPKSLLDQINELGSAKEAIEKVFGGGGGTNVIPRKFGWVETAKELLAEAQPFLQPIGDGLGQLLAARANPAPANGQPPQARVQQQPAAGANDNVLQFVSKAMFTHFDNADTGSEFAAWLYNGMPDEFDSFQTFKHPRLPNMQGADAIVTAFSYSKYWDAIKEREPQFRAFVAEFCAWVKPGAEDVEVVDPEPDQQPAEVVDFDQEQM